MAPGTVTAIISNVVLFSFRASRGKIASADILLEEIHGGAPERPSTRRRLFRALKRVSGAL